MSERSRGSDEEPTPPEEVLTSGREPWAYRTDPGGAYYQQNRILSSHVDRRSIGQDTGACSFNVPRTLNTLHSAYPGQQGDALSHYHDVVESTRRLNLGSTQHPQDVGVRHGEYSHTPQRRSYDVYPQTGQPPAGYHLPSAPSNPPPTAAPTYSSDGNGYDTHISNSQLGYFPRYPIQSERDNCSPPTFTSSPYPNSNHVVAYGNFPSGFTHPSQPSMIPPVWSGQRGDPMNHGVQLRPLSGDVTSRRVSAGEGTELGPATRIGQTDVSQMLDESYRIRSHPRRYFKVGQVFSVLWHEPAGKTGTTLTLYNEHVHSKIRRMVVLLEKQDCCWCLPIHTYGGRGIDKPSINHKTHAVIRTPDVSCYGKLSTMIQDEFIVTPEAGETLARTSLLDFGKVYTVEHNSKVKSVGKLTAGGAALLASI
ncbi:hypothetical protein AJ78_05067 [Emergomyces pasteurianus Ep9510]|uniref:DUF6590 domain-containing protein n=1 Tax=Emergomyces pasteurianus Ep9510 TaxID=1447872 RepID=A0A1J9QEP5_9EURO|nr:hypothetical protein AJ78_05067 [Emergomyces pasteurianus Ep9510]